jgi:hypothetical protein
MHPGAIFQEPETEGKYAVGLASNILDLVQAGHSDIGVQLQ